MSLAPASSRGAFLKARLAVNGIQCAARSFGTLTAGWAGLLSSMGASFHVCGATEGRKLPASQLRGNSTRRDISAQAGVQADIQSASEIGSRDPEHLALGVFRVEPEQRQRGEGGLEVVAAAADLAK